MSVELVALEPELKKKSADTELLMERLAKDQAAADKVREVVQVEEAAAKVRRAGAEHEERRHAQLPQWCLLDIQLAQLCHLTSCFTWRLINEYQWKM